MQRNINYSHLYLDALKISLSDSSNAISPTVFDKPGQNTCHLKKE